MNPNDDMWPGIPATLKYVDLRLPGTFRELVANRSYTDAEIGKIIRCIALDTDFFINQKIEAEVFYYRKKMIEKNRTRLRVDACRKRKKAGTLASEMNGYQDGHRCVTVTPDDSAADAPKSDSLFSTVKTPTSLVEKTPPIVPLEKKPSPALESQSPRRKKKSPREQLADSLQNDLFALVSDCGSGDLLAARQKTRTGSPETHPNGSDASIHVQDIESDSRGIQRVPDTRNDAAWIPERFAVFWNAYPRRIAKASAVKAFTKLIRQQKDVDKFMKTVLSSLEWWKTQESWKKDNGKFIPYPATWINKGCWEDINENNAGEGEAEFLRESSETEDELLRRMQG